MSEMPRYRWDHLPPPDVFGLFRKVTSTRMVRVEGPFVVETREGVMFCRDGWLAVDSAGWPYAIAAAEQAAIYAPVDTPDDPTPHPKPST